VKFSVDKIKTSKSKELIRFYTAGDDWRLFNANLDAIDCCNYFISRYNLVDSGEVGGLGFHPWILFSDEKIWDGFLLFLRFLREQENLNLFLLKDFYKIITATK
jgi:peptidoglycan-N-acetylglucosamine deacetylase